MYRNELASLLYFKQHAYRFMHSIIALPIYDIDIIALSIVITKNITQNSLIIL